MQKAWHSDFFFVRPGFEIPHSFNFKVTCGSIWSLQFLRGNIPTWIDDNTQIAGYTFTLHPIALKGKGERRAGVLYRGIIEIQPTRWRRPHQAESLLLALDVHVHMPFKCECFCPDDYRPSNFPSNYSTNYIWSLCLLVFDKLHQRQYQLSSLSRHFNFIEISFSPEPVQFCNLNVPVLVRLS